MAANMNDNEFIRKFSIFSQEKGIFVAKWLWIFLDADEFNTVTTIDEN